MKRLSYILFITFALCLMGCRKNVNNHDTPGEGQLLLLKASTSALIVPKTSTGAANKMPDGLLFGVYVHDRDLNMATPDTKNRKYKSLKNSLIHEDVLGIYVKPGKSYFVYGYSPYKSFEVGTLGYTKIPFSHGEDVLLPSEVAYLTNVAPDRTSVTLDFEHLTVQIKFVVQSMLEEDGEVLNEGINKDTEIEITGFESQATLNLLTGKLTPVIGATGVSIKATAAEEVTKLETALTCFFVPENGQKKLNIKISIPKKDDLFAVIDEAWVAGSSYTYHINIIGMMNPTVIVGETRVFPWQDEILGNDGDNDLPLPF